jgi:hypothetical protein
MTQKSTNKPQVTIHRKDYTAPAYWVNTVEMGFDLDPAATRVATRITLQQELIGSASHYVFAFSFHSSSIASSAISPTSS